MRTALITLALSLLAACATTAAIAPDPTEPYPAWGTPSATEKSEASFGSRLIPGDLGPDYAGIATWNAAAANSCAFSSQCGGGSFHFGTCSPLPPGR